MSFRSNQRWGARPIERLEERRLLAADVYISEFSAVNESLLEDEDGTFPDWIEIYNAGPEDVDLSTWYLTDNAEDLSKWQFPADLLSAGSYLLVYASGKDRAVPGEPLHTNFKLTSEGEFLAISNAQDGALTEVFAYAPGYPAQQADVSYGVAQTQDAGQVVAGDRVYFDAPTPGAKNASEGIAGFLFEQIEFSQSPGFYEQAFTLGMTTTEDASIRYTTDGSEPSETNGFDYQNAVSISATTTIRARAVRDGWESSPVQTGTFLFLDDVVQQTPTTTIAAGFPSSTSINGQLIDYGMDPAIVNSGVWGPQLDAALTQIPSLSVVMDVDDLMDSRVGIFVNANGKGDRWERAASLELLNPDGSEGFQVDAGIRIRGGYSRNDANPKHSFRFLFREEYGDAKLEYPMFGDEGVSEFDKLDLRTAQNYSWAFSGNASNTMLRDVFSRDMQREMGHPYTRSRFYHLYLNGQYWGVFQTQERSEARYAASNLGGDREDYDIVKNADSLAVGATDGNLDAYNRLAERFYQDGGLGDTNLEEYMKAQGMNLDGSRNPAYERLLDVDNLIDYMIITYYTGDKDGPGSRFTTPRVNNYYAIYNRENPDGWKFMEHDSEHTFDVGDRNMVQPYANGGAELRYFNPHWAHQQLADSNSVYRLRFADRVTELFFNDGLFTPENVTSMIDARAAEIDMAIVAESARWGDAKRTSPRTKNDWLAAVQRVRDFTDSRAETVIEQFRSVGWYPHVNPPEFTVDGVAQHGGDIAPGQVLAMSVADPVLDFDRRLVSARSTWKYLDQGVDLGTDWRANGFDDDAWESGRGQLGYGGNGERTEVGFGTSANDKHVTTYFRKTFSVSSPEDFAGLRLGLVRDDGAVVYLNGEEIVRSNMPSGPIDFDTAAASVASSSAETEFFEYRVDPDRLLDGENVLAVEVHQVKNGSRVTSSDISFDLELLGAKAPSQEGTVVYFTEDGTDPRNALGEVAASASLFEEGLVLSSAATIVARARDLDGVWGPVVRAPFRLPTSDLLGDVNQDERIDAQDVDLMAATIRRGDAAPRFDINRDEAVDRQDYEFLIESVFKTVAGDADLDGDVDFADFLTVSANFGRADSSWSQGNFTLDDDEIGFADFLLLSANFGAVR